ncbi:MAG: acyl carrier protein [Chitinivibrionales bacterium]|nr:acyl carrier protein [Chitinivibrionales bacterium]
MSNQGSGAHHEEATVREIVREFIVNNFLFGDGAKLSDTTSFLEGKIIDSTGILELITFLEEKYAIKIDDTELLPENLDSLEKIACFIQRKVGK